MDDDVKRLLRTPKRPPPASSDMIAMVDEHLRSKSLTPSSIAPKNPTMGSTTGVCGVCREILHDGEPNAGRQPGCGHAVHLSCFAKLVRVSRARCTQCPAPSIDGSDGVYTVDVGNDADVRAAVARALEYRRGTVRDALIAEAHARVVGGMRTRDTRLRTVLTARAEATLSVDQLCDVEPLLYASDRLPHSPGGGTCALDTCGGQHLCVHRHLAPVTCDAVYSWRVYDEARPVRASDRMCEARNAIDRLLRARAAPRDLVRCGADAERLAVCDVTINRLVRIESMLLEHVVPALELNWQRMLALDFDPSLLRYRRAFPVSVLAAQPVAMNAEKMLRIFSFEYCNIDVWGLTQEELFVLGFDAQLLMQLGMCGEHVLSALAEETTRQRGVTWWVRIMRYTDALHTHCFRTTNVRDLDAEAHKHYMELVAALRRVDALDDTRSECAERGNSKQHEYAVQDGSADEHSKP